MIVSLIRPLVASCGFLLILGCKGAGNDAPDTNAPDAVALHFLLRGTDETGGTRPLSGQVHVEQRDPHTGMLVAEFFAGSNASGNVDVLLAGVTPGHAYTVRVSVNDAWHFAPESVAFFYGLELLGHALPGAFAQPVALEFQPNDAIAYWEKAGTVADYAPGRFTAPEDAAVYEVTLAMNGVREQLVDGPCESFIEDFAVIYGGAAAVELVVHESASSTSTCAQHYTGRFLAALSTTEQAALAAGEFTWNSAITQVLPYDGSDSRTVIFFAESGLLYLETTLIGER